jgi:hypothetical protein
MATAADIIILSLKDCQIIDESETPSSYTMADALATLNQMLASWAVDKQYVYAQTDVTFAPTGALSYTIGSGGNINTTAPSSIDIAFLRATGGLDFPIEILTSFGQYQSIWLKAVQAYPEFLYYNPSYPLGTIYLYPQPIAANGTMHLVVSTPFPVYGAAANSITLPAEYEMAIRFSLAEYLSTMFGKPVSRDIAMHAKRARDRVKRNNLRITPLDTGDSVTPGFARIQRGY